VNQIRKRLTYANVMSSIAVFLVLGGATAFAAGQLAKNSVGAKQLKKNSVTAAKIKNNAVTGAKIQNGAIVGSKINLGSLGTVPSATNAANATNATTAANANATNGMHLSRLNFITGNNAPATTLFAGNGLTLTASCSGSSLEFTGSTSVGKSEIYESGNFDSTYKGGFNDDFNPGEIEEIGEEIGDGSQDEVQGQLVYSTPSGSTVTAEFFLDDSSVFGGTSGCAVVGTVVFS
jgi:type II secretory pathway pseudopilin PulG